MAPQPFGRIGCFFVAALLSQTFASGSEPISHGDLDQLKREVVANYAAIVSASYQDALLGAKRLKKAVEQFVAAPSEDGLAAVRKAWLTARVPYSQTEAFRFYDGP